MAVVTVSQVNFTGNGSAGSVQYYASDIQQLLAQSGADAVQVVNVVVTVDVGGVTGGSADAECTAMIALRSDGSQIKNSDSLLGLPCPKYCRS